MSSITLNHCVNTVIQNISGFHLIYLHLLWKQSELNYIKSIFILNVSVHTGI